ncbi:hypothetical protein [Kaistella yonginensis]|uniref:hypothetical protein n=1 Tax=Kaistella yonginensis TaxID=658267 RepID=UPI0025B38716|nr:hypothetical protein [Kaistella yonginensis]MDN3606392.1 hypothetical protein [Kaistella yonginensis]
MKNLQYLVIYISIFFLLGCKNKNVLTEDDYKIMELIIQKTVTVDDLSLLEKDSAMQNLKPGTSQYQQKLNDLFDMQNYESDYYYCLEDSLFVFKNNFYLKEQFEKIDFDGDRKNLIPLKIDFSKIKTKKHLIRIDKSSPLIKSERYIGEAKLSRIAYDGNTAAIIIIIDGYYRAIGFYKKDGDNWMLFFGDRIPFKIGENKIDL